MTQSAASIVGVTTKYSTLCGPLNRLLDGGLKQGCILELSGAPGCGKEALAVNISRSYVDSSKGVLFIDMQNMTTPATLDRLLRKSSHTVSAYQKLVRHLQLHTLLDLMVFLQNLPSYLQNHPDIALIVLNSLSFPFQSPDVTYAVRNAVLDKVKQILAKTVASTRVTVVITSQLATKMYKADGSAANFDTGSRAIMVPLLGPSTFTTLPNDPSLNFV
ncbi:uncharacterized protein FIBRA_00224 [Fibroporia radiculosa]|uniref:Rad51-like C-terminal domain-containing protein n=1 Tax=Fibroporia radiculosa TaxID=599839 RepID=J7RV69_9APHY|nr:uncharacterized protein FIBRA_00224 [Fibroporia radiculosa]CCL98230.1 predicted protein [Fibroporia radiculosa]